MSTDKLGVIIGRFQPPHNGHMALFRKAVEIGCTSIQVLLGSAYEPRTVKNPFSNRRALFRLALADAGITTPVYFKLLEDDPYRMQKWVESVKRLCDSGDVVLIGAKKDASSFYLNHFPDWEFASPDEDPNAISATTIREALFEDRLKDVEHLLSPSVFTALQGFSLEKEEWFQRLIEEHLALREAKTRLVRVADGETSKYPYAFLAADCLVEWRGKVLLVRRGKAPGKGLLALPGGFVNAGERFLDAALRELNEETGLRIHVGKHAKRLLLDPTFLRAQKVFDKPDRDPRGRVITTASHFRIPDACKVAVKAGDDAAQVEWAVPQSLGREDLFSDHYYIIQDFLGDQL